MVEWIKNSRTMIKNVLKQAHIRQNSNQIVTLNIKQVSDLSEILKWFNYYFSNTGVLFIIIKIALICLLGDDDDDDWCFTVTFVHVVG